MQINLWRNESMNLWRWTLIDGDLNMKSGQQKDLKLALTEIANSVEYLINKSNN